jgi:ribosomal protein S18 acetylase RimI-like enzyme
MPINIRIATLAELDQLAPLFDAYRQFYGLPADLGKASAYLQERMAREESTVLIAFAENGEAIGFSQLYPSFCSLAAAPIFILYDLYIAPSARGQGVGRALLQRAAEYGRKAGAARLDLSTAKDNIGAQTLYESLGWVRDDVFFTYSLALE